MVRTFSRIIVTRCAFSAVRSATCSSRTFAVVVSVITVAIRRKLFPVLRPSTGGSLVRTIAGDFLVQLESCRIKASMPSSKVPVPGFLREPYSSHLPCLDFPCRIAPFPINQHSHFRLPAVLFVDFCLLSLFIPSFFSLFDMIGSVELVFRFLLAGLSFAGIAQGLAKKIPQRSEDDFL